MIVPPQVLIKVQHTNRIKIRKIDLRVVIIKTQEVYNLCSASDQKKL